VSDQPTPSPDFSRRRRAGRSYYLGDTFSE
jgi:hypothetical protein